MKKNLSMQIRAFKSGLLVFLLLVSVPIFSQKVIDLTPVKGDMTRIVREAFQNASGKDLIVNFKPGTYHFSPDFAFEKYCYITNHGNGLKRIIFPFNDFESVEINGNGAELIFHGQVLPFLFENCKSVKTNDLVIDWDIPFTFQGEVIAVNKEEGWRDIKPESDGFSWVVKDKKLLFPNIDGFNFSTVGSTLPFDPEPKRVSHGAWDIYSNPEWVEERADGILRFHEKLKYYPPVGSILNSKGPSKENRYAPAIHVKSSSNIEFTDITIHHALGMGFLLERSENAKLNKCSVKLREDSPRVVSIIADATHFCNCKGDVIVENCVFENMLDDGTNVHGTYVAVDEVIDEKTVRVELKHFQQLGFKFAGEGDEIWFVHQPDPSRASVNVVKAVNVLNEQFIELSFKETLPSKLETGDLLENKTWNPTFTMRRCTIQNHRARNIVLKTPKKILIEENEFSSMMSSVFFRGESFYWFESGAVEDVIIRNNKFNYCAYSGMEHAVLNITPRLGAIFNKSLYDRNIRFEDNIIKTFGNRIVWADRVDGLIISNNTITQTFSESPLYPNTFMFDLSNCRNIEIRGNVYEGKGDYFIKADPETKKSIVFKDNKGF